jgi:hypothetical protein
VLTFPRLLLDPVGDVKRHRGGTERLSQCHAVAVRARAPMAVKVKQ